MLPYRPDGARPIESSILRRSAHMSALIKIDSLHTGANGALGSAKRPRVLHHIYRSQAKPPKALFFATRDEYLSS
jgi:hypothetical protein